MPRSILPQHILAIIPFAGFLCITAMGEALVLMSRGIDLSIPAIMTLSSTVLLGVSGGQRRGPPAGGRRRAALRDALGLHQRVPGRRGKLNALIVTLAVGAITQGATLWYRESLPAGIAGAAVLADWGGTRILGSTSRSGSPRSWSSC